jgi:flagella basal body P-ring formation protein FlgA
VQWPAGRLALGRQRVGLVLLRGQEEAGRLDALVEAAVTLPVLVAARDLAPGEPLGPGDAVPVRLRLTDLGAEHLSDPGQLAGLCPARAIRAGAALEARSLTRLLLVRRGQPVTVLAECGAVSVRDSATAMGDGGLGDLVTVERRGTRVRLLGRVTDAQTVKVGEP